MPTSRRRQRKVLHSNKAKRSNHRRSRRSRKRNQPHQPALMGGIQTRGAPLSVYRWLRPPEEQHGQPVDSAADVNDVLLANSMLNDIQQANNDSNKSDDHENDQAAAAADQSWVYEPALAPTAAHNQQLQQTQHNRSVNKVSQMRFQCQLAHGSPTAFVSGFETQPQLYRQVATAFDLPADAVQFCTLNTHRLDMDKLMHTLTLNDFIFAHIKGERKQIEVKKTRAMLGVTLCDNGAGKVFIKRVLPGSTAESLAPAIAVGDQILSIDDEACEGLRHIQVAAKLRLIAVNQTFKLRVVAVHQSPLDMLRPRQALRQGTRSLNHGPTAGTKTIRFKWSGAAVIEETDPNEAAALRVSGLLEEYFGVSDLQLAQALTQHALKHTNPCTLYQSVAHDPELAALELPANLLWDVYGAVQDVAAGRELRQPTPPPPQQAEEPYRKLQLEGIEDE